MQARAAEVRRTLGSPATVLLGVDRLDYTKGIEVRLRAFRELLAEGRLLVDDCVLVQIAEPSRSQVTGYGEVRRAVEQQVGDVNGNFGVMGRPVVHYLHQSHPIEELVAMYLIADVMLVTPLRDGMNLVAKEYVACRPDNTGVLVLSEFTGAAQELRTADLINPHDIEGLKTQNGGRRPPFRRRRQTGHAGHEAGRAHQHRPTLGRALPGPPGGMPMTEDQLGRHHRGRRDHDRRRGGRPLRELARVPVLLVACDYDGTLAPIIDNPDDARPTRESVPRCVCWPPCPTPTWR